MRDSRSRSSGDDGPPVSSRGRASIPTASGCASDGDQRDPGSRDRSGRRADRRRRASADVRAGRLRRARRPARRRAAGRRRHALPRGRLPELPRDGRWHRLRPDLPGRLPARPRGRPASGARPAAAPRRIAVRTSPARRSGRRSRSSGARSRSRSSAAVRADSRRPQRPVPPAGTSWSSMPRMGTRSWRSTPARRSSRGPTPACSTSTPTRSSSRPVRPRSTRSARATTWPGWSRPAPRSDCTGRVSTWAGRWRSGRRQTACHANTLTGCSSGSKATRPDESGPSSPRIPRPAPRRRRRATPRSWASVWRRGTSWRGWPDRSRVTVVGDAADEHPLPPAPTDGVVCRCHGVTVEDLQGTWDKGFQELELIKRASLACLGTVPGWRLPPAGPVLDRRPIRGGPGAVHRPARVPADHPGRGRRGRPHRCVPADAAARGARGPGRADGPLRRVVAAVALRRRDRRVLGRPRGRLDRRRQHARQARRVRSGRRRVPRAAVPVPRRGHQARSLAVRAAAQRARPRHGRRHDPARVRDPVRAELHVRRRRQRRDVDPRLDRRVGPARPRHGSDDVPRRDQRDRAAREAAPDPRRPRRPAPLPRPCPRRRRRRPVPRHAPVVHRRGGLGAAPPDRPARSQLWRALMELGDDLGIRPHGLQALFALRLEKGHVIVGMDTELDSTPRRLGMDWAARMDKPRFIGRAALERTAKLPGPPSADGLHDGRATHRSRARRSGRTATSSATSPAAGRRRSWAVR